MPLTDIENIQLFITITADSCTIEVTFKKTFNIYYVYRKNNESLCNKDYLHEKNIMYSANLKF